MHHWVKRRVRHWANLKVHQNLHSNSFQRWGRWEIHSHLAQSSANRWLVPGRRIGGGAVSWAQARGRCRHRRERSIGYRAQAWAVGWCQSGGPCRQLRWRFRRRPRWKCSWCVGRRPCWKRCLLHRWCVRRRLRWKRGWQLCWGVGRRICWWLRRGRIGRSLLLCCTNVGAAIGRKGRNHLQPGWGSIVQDNSRHFGPKTRFETPGIRTRRAKVVWVAYFSGKLNQERLTKRKRHVRNTFSTGVNAVLQSID